MKLFGIFGKSWEILGNLGNFWEILGNLGNFWEFLGNIIWAKATPILLPKKSTVFLNF
jgi:hypothetical protein